MDDNGQTGVDAAIGRLLDFVVERQADDGSWHGDYGGPMFLLPMYVGTAYATGMDLARDRDDIARYFRAHQNADGGFGLHTEGASHVFTSVLGYMAMRMLGLEAGDAAVRRAREFCLDHGGPRASASWGKFFLALMNLYDYRGLAPVPPELWLLPESLPMHPSRLWCHCRMVYLPMSYLYGRRARMPEDELVRALRAELYDQPYHEIDWPAARETVSPTDSYVPVSPAMKMVNRVLLAYEQRPSRRLRERALAFVREQMRAEDRHTDYFCIGPVNKLFHTLAAYWDDPRSEGFRRHSARLSEYLWGAADGTKMQGYNNSRLWDTTFMVQALVRAADAPAASQDSTRDSTGDSIPAGGRERTARAHQAVTRAYRYIEHNQVLEDVPDRETYFRDPSKGGWPFSDRAHGWPITDCTAEGLKAALMLESTVPRPIPAERLGWALDLIIWWQNADGGWATYERTRGPRWLERLNPSDCFADIMIDYSYVECTSACLQAMAAYKQRFPGRRDRDIDRATAAGVEFLLRAQRADGSFEGSWGVCFSYGTWFGVRGLRAAGLPAEHPAIERACDFLAARELPAGGWGETPESSRARRWVDASEGQAVMTSWVMLALLAGPRRHFDAVRRGAAYLVSRQREDGSFPEEHIAGMFNKTCAIHYDNYLEIFPLWALAEARLAGCG